MGQGHSNRSERNRNPHGQKDEFEMASTCKHCFVDGLQWKQLNGRWRLFYESGQPHTCIATRATIAKSIPKPYSCRTQEEQLLIGWSKAALKLKTPETVVPLTDDYRHPSWDFLDGGEPKRITRSEAAKQQAFGELIP
jgi:hypothetical protein